MEEKVVHVTPSSVVYADMVERLNMDLFENDELRPFLEEWGVGFSYMTDGYINVIEIMDFALWNDDNDEREYIEEIDDYEPLEDYIRKSFNNIMETFSKISI